MKKMRLDLDEDGSILSISSGDDVRPGFEPVSELANFHRKDGDSARFEGPGLVDGALVADAHLREFIIDQDGRMAWRPRWAAPTSAFYATVKNTTFKNLVADHTYFGSTRFQNCRFENVQLQFDPGLVQAHFENCYFSGCWEGNFTTEADLVDNVRKLEFVGNDLTDLVGFTLMDVPLDMLMRNKFDLGGNHLAIGPKFPSWQQVQEILPTQPPYIADKLLLLSGRRPISKCEILVCDAFPPDIWAELTSHPCLTDWSQLNAVR